MSAPPGRNPARTWADAMNIIDYGSADGDRNHQVANKVATQAHQVRACSTAIRRALDGINEERAKEFEDLHSAMQLLHGAAVRLDEFHARITAALEEADHG